MRLMLEYGMYMLFSMIVAAPVYLLIRYVCYRFRPGNFIRSREVAICLNCIYCFGILSLAVLPTFDWILFFNEGKMSWLPMGITNLYVNNVYPFLTISEYIFMPEREFGLYMLLGRILLYLPLGVLIPCLNKEKINFKITITSVLCFSGLIECMQSCIRQSCNIDDVILALIGAAIGYLIWTSIWRIGATCRK